VCAIPYHLETSLQSIISGYQKQKLLAYLTLIVVLGGGFLIGYLLIFVVKMEIYGIFMTTFILELILTILSFYFYKKLN
jgi:Na+-driven multidrug efflux pump